MNEDRMLNSSENLRAQVLFVSAMTLSYMNHENIAVKRMTAASTNRVRVWYKIRTTTSAMSAAPKCLARSARGTPGAPQTEAEIDPAKTNKRPSTKNTVVAMSDTKFPAATHSSIRSSGR